MGVTFPGESAEYRAARDRLLEQEAEMRRAVEAVAAARRELPPGGAVAEDYVFHGAGRRRRPDRREALGALRARQGHPRHLQHDVPARPRRGPAVPVVHAVPGLLRRRRRARRPARERRDRRQGRAAAPARPRRRPRLAAAAPALVGRQRLQPRLPRRDAGRLAAAADAQRLSPRRRRHPPLLGLGAPLRAAGPRPGPAPRRDHRPVVEPLRLRPGGPRDRLVPG